MRHIIIGSGIAGISAAKAIQAHDSAAEITVFTNEVHPLGLYARKELARRLVDGIREPATFLIEDSETLKKRGINLRYEEVVRVFAHKSHILVNHSIRRDYDRLLLAVGATPKLVDAPGLHLIGVHQLRNYEDVNLIETWIPELQMTGAVIIGGGLLALDMAYALRQRNVPTTLVVRDLVLGLSHLSASAGELLAQRLQLHGINVLFNRTIAAYLSDDDRILDAVQLDNGQIIPARLALSAIGVQPSTDFLEGSSIAIDEPTQAIPVNQFMQTNIENVYAAGNCALVNGHIAHNWSLSAEQGYTAGCNMAGFPVAYQPSVLGDLHTQVYDLPLAYFGQTVANAEITVWQWTDHTSQLAEIYSNDGQVIGATLLGNLAALAPDLFELHKIKTPGQAEQLEQLIWSRVQQPTV